MEYRTMPTVMLIDLIAVASHNGDQEKVNDIALELVKRIYVPNAETTFEELLYKFGYRDNFIKSRS